MQWTEVLRDLGVATVGMAVLGWVAREVASRWLDNRVESFREQLRRESTEHQVRFESLHQQRAEALLAIWRSIKLASAAIGEFTSPAQFGGHERQDLLGESAGQATTALRKSVFDNSIFFPEDVATKLTDVARRLDSLWFSAWLDYKEARKEGRNPYMGEGGVGKSEFGKAWKDLSIEIAPLSTELEREFRSLLGVK